MSAFFSRKYQRLVSAQTRVEGDLFCSKCGYNARGLVYGRACPECGHPIELPVAGEGDSVLTRAPTHVRDRMLLGARLAIAGLVLGGLIKVVMLAALGAIPSMAGFAATVVAAGLFGLGAFLLMQPEIDHTDPAMRPLRVVARWGQLLWGPGLLCAWLRIGPWQGTGQADLLFLPDLLCRTIAGVAALAAAVVLLRIAEAATLERAERRFNAFVWIMPLLAILMAFIVPSGSMPWIMLFIVGVPTLAWLVLMLIFAQGLWDIQTALAWSRRSYASSLGREQRLAETRADIDADVEARIRPVDPSKGDVPIEGTP